MEDGAKEQPAQQKQPKFLGKAGWVKKGYGRLLASYKDRYVHVEKTEVVVYENEELQNCIERFDLESYDKCHDLKSPFKRKHRLILIRSPKSGNKVHDVKFQAQTAEEKEAWIKALADGINRAKNKVFDEVKVDESSNLEHVTRTRPKGNRNRRPPTRIHMKEVADVSSDGVLRLDLDLDSAVMPNGTHHAAVDGTNTAKDTKATTPWCNSGGPAESPCVQNADDKAPPESQESSQKKVIKPPMPPTKEAKASSASQDEQEKDSAEKKVLKPPMPPIKEAKPCPSPVQEATEEAKSEQVSEVSPEARKKTDPPPTPPNKPSSHNSMNNLLEASQSSVISPPTPPSKEKKPCHQTVEPDQELQSSEQENKQKEEVDSMKETVVETQKEDVPITEEQLPHVEDDKPESSSTDGEDSDEDLQEPFSGVNSESNNESDIPTEPPRKSPSPPPTSIKNPDTLENSATATHVAHGPDISASDTSTSSLQADDSMPESEVPSIIVSLNDSLTDSLNLSPLLCHSSGEKKQKSEEKSVDSGQHSDDESECSGCEDTLAASTAALRGSHVGLDVLDNSEDDIQTSVRLEKQAPNKPPIKPKSFASHCLGPTVPLTCSAKTKSASSGDLLASEIVYAQVKQPRRADNESMDASHEKVMKLESEVAVEMENTSDLLSRVSDPQKGPDGEGLPEDLLAKAMEKLKKADSVLREVNKLKLKHNSQDRKSW
ncbi:unnamed protein product [Ophioblennius macclurei]